MNAKDTDVPVQPETERRQAWREGYEAGFRAARKETLSQIHDALGLRDLIYEMLEAAK